MFEGLSCDSKGGESAERHVRACTFLFILHEGERTVEKKKAERAEKPFPFFGSSHRQVDGLHVHLSVRDGHKVRA